MFLQYTHFLQFTEEKLGQAEKTELDPHLENLISRADGTKNWTEKILRQTEVVLQPNPSKWITQSKKTCGLPAMSFIVSQPPVTKQITFLNEVVNEKQQNWKTYLSLFPLTIINIMFVILV